MRLISEDTSEYSPNDVLNLPWGVDLVAGRTVRSKPESVGALQEAFQACKLGEGASHSRLTSAEGPNATSLEPSWQGVRKGSRSERVDPR